MGSHVLLRAPTDDDLDDLAAMFAEPAVAERWPGMDRDRIIEEVIHDDDPDSTQYVIEVDGELAGVIQSWEEPDPEYRHAGMDISLKTKWHGKGVAVDALRTLATHLIRDKDHHRLTIDPAADNARAIACYAKIGFKPVGVLRRYERGPDGTFHDGLLMDLLADEMT